MAEKRTVQVDTKRLEEELQKAGMKPNNSALRRLAAEIEKKLSKTK